jgi:hypothetical protein
MQVVKTHKKFQEKLLQTCDLANQKWLKIEIFHAKKKCF